MLVSERSMLLKRPYWLLVTLIVLLAGSAVVIYAYNYAAVVQPDNGDIHFSLFWAGQFLFFVPVLVWLLRADLVSADRVFLLAALGAFDYLPKYLRDPNGPLFHDELAHWRQADLLQSSGTLFQSNPTVGIIQFFPGLHSATAAIADVSGLSVFQVATVLLCVLHVLAMLGIYLLAARLTGSLPAAGFAAVIYSLNPSFMFFDAQFSYESLAIVMAIWLLVCAAMCHKSTSPLRLRLGWALSGALLCGALAVTHHLTTYITVLMLICSFVPVFRTGWHRKSRRVGVILVAGLTVALLAGALAWLYVVASDTIGYLAPSVTGGISQVIGMIQREQNSSHELFAGSTLPRYERICSFLSPAIAGVAALFGLKRLRFGRRPLPMLVGMCVFALLYFPSTVFILTPNGSEGARRSWAFTYIGLALLTAPAVVSLVRLAGTSRLKHFLCAGLVILLLCVVFVGNSAMGMNETYEFPGAFVYGSDTLSYTQETQDMAKWFLQTYGPDRNVVSDRYNGLSLSSIGLAWTASASEGFPVYELYFRTTPASANLFGELEYSGYQFMVTDLNMARYLPRIGIYFEPDEPEGQVRTTPPPMSAITKYEQLPWVIKVFQSNNLAVYRFNFTALGLAWNLPREGQSQP